MAREDGMAKVKIIDTNGRIRSHRNSLAEALHKALDKKNRGSKNKNNKKVRRATS